MNNSFVTNQIVSSVPLDQPLPPDLVTGATWGPFKFRMYPVFSLPWLKGRTLFIAGVCILYGAVSSLAYVALKLSWDRVLMSWFSFVLGFVLMSVIGPGLATWVRHRRWSSHAETWGLIAAVVIGLVAAPVVDFWASGSIRKALKPKEVPAKEQKLGDLEKAQLAIGSMFALIFYFGLGGGMSLLGYFSERRRLNARHANLLRLDGDMRLAVLQAQVEPHFLFNTLAAIRPMIRQDAIQAETALDALTDHLRATIPVMRATLQGGTSTLGQQLDICRSYLAVMQVRMGSRLHYDFQCPDELRAREFPPMLLLSLVENAIKHGIEPKPGPGSVRVEVKANGRPLTVSVIDDGTGLKPGLSGGIGLANIREQLAMRFGTQASLKVAARPEGGTMAVISVPSVISRS